MAVPVSEATSCTPQRTTVAITGATGYMGRALTRRLVERGHQVLAVARHGSSQRVVKGANVRQLDPLDVNQLTQGLAGASTVVHLIGTAHPGPGKAMEFQQVDLASARACVTAAVCAGVKHFVYVSVAQPAPVMKAYLAARAEAEGIIADSGLAATILRPWYVLGPGHRWPVLLLPLYALARLFPATRDGALRLGLVTLGQMTNALVRAVESTPRAGHPAVIDVPGIRATG